MFAWLDDWASDGMFDCHLSYTYLSALYFFSQDMYMESYLPQFSACMCWVRIL